MALISKSDLFYSDYSWNAIPGDDPRVTGSPDDTMLNRKEGYEILYFVNRVAKDMGLIFKNDAIKIERMIREDVPGSIRTQRGIEEWIRRNW